MAVFAYYLPSNLINLPVLALQGVRPGPGFQSKGRMFVRSKGQMAIGANVRINSSPYANPIGGNERSYFQILVGGRLTIGDHCGMSNVAITCASAIRIGNGVRLGSGVCIFDTDFHSLSPVQRTSRAPGTPEHARTAEVVIEDNVFIGTRTLVLKGTTIGRNSVIGAGSVVTGIVPPNQIWAGNPARYVRELTAEELQGAPPSNS